MAYKNNPFFDRASERATSDQEFVRVFSPKILERLGEDLFGSVLHVFRSPPGGGKTTLLRAFTPLALRAFWNSREQDAFSESVARLVTLGALTESDGPAVLGVFLSSASGYADLPPGVPVEQEGIFRTLLDCRIVLRTLRSIAALLDLGGIEGLDRVRLHMGERDSYTHIPSHESASELYRWAERREREVYSYLDSIRPKQDPVLNSHRRFEGALWLQDIEIYYRDKKLELGRLLMIDDVHKLRRHQRDLLLQELPDLRLRIPVWLAERTTALGSQLLSLGAREGRDIKPVRLDELWVSDRRGPHQFYSFAQSILDRRLASPKSILRGQFNQYLKSDLDRDAVKDSVSEGIAQFWRRVAQFKDSMQYKEWLRAAEEASQEVSVSALETLYKTRILIARDERKKQFRLALEPLPQEELEERDSSQVQGAAEIFMHEELSIPYYFGIDRFCVLATNNVEELLASAADVYDALQAKHIVRRETILSAFDQEKIVRQIAERRWNFIPKGHAEGARTQRLLAGMGAYCRSRTFLPNAPYAPGVTGVRLTQSEMRRLEDPDQSQRDQTLVLRTVLAESVAENLLVCKATSRDDVPDGVIFYFNRTLCAYFNLPLQYGGWQDVGVSDLLTWMQGQYERTSTAQTLATG